MAWTDTPPPPGGAAAGFFAALAAGSIFVACYALATWIDGAAVRSGSIDPAALGIATGILALSVPFGALIALLPCIVVAIVLTPIARRPGIGRLHAPWLLIGALTAGSLARLGDAGASETFAFAATGGLCALIARRVLLRQMRRQR